MKNTVAGFARWCLSHLGILLWSMALLLSLAMTNWMLWDGRFYTAIPEWIGNSSWIPLSDFAIKSSNIRPPTTLRLQLFNGLLLATLAVIASIGLHLIKGPASTRNIRSILGLTAIIAYWLFLGRECESIVELGRSTRLSMQVSAIEHFAQEVDANWKELCEPNSTCSTDLKLSNLLAYPVSNPRMCMFAGSFRLPQSTIEISSIERTEGESIRFQLGGEHLGYWIEKRWDGRWPQTFRSGLEYSMTPIKISQIKDTLYLVRYRD
jgi:hypothetical protein